MSDLPARLAHLWRLTWCDLWYERWLAICAACVLAATLAPLWTLWGLERGVIGTLIERQNRDPAMRLLIPEATGAHRFDAEWFNRVRNWPRLAFVLPEMRSIASQVDLFADEAMKPVRVDFIPTDHGDPLLTGQVPPPPGQLILSQRAARQLGVQAGQSVTLDLERERNGTSERATLVLTVASVLPVTQQDGNTALAQLPLLQDIQAWRDGYTVAHLSSEGNGVAPITSVYPRFRAYAQSIQDVEALSARFEREGISVYTRAREIASTLGLQRNLRAVLGMVALIAATGAAVALVAMQISAVQRKRRDHALLQLLGHGRGWLISISCLASSATALLGAFLAFGVYLAAAGAINAYFARYLGTGEAAVTLGSQGFALGVLAVWVMSVLPALVGGWRASNVEAADVLRDN